MAVVYSKKKIPADELNNSVFHAVDGLFHVFWQAKACAKGNFAQIGVIGKKNKRMADPVAKIILRRNCLKIYLFGFQGDFQGPLMVIIIQKCYKNIFFSMWPLSGCHNPNVRH
jgi:hypothetical protein